jgi:hypothetical protein
VVTVVRTVDVLIAQLVVKVVVAVVVIPTRAVVVVKVLDVSVEIPVV